MKKIFKTTIELKDYMESAYTKAIENTANILKDKLQEFVESQYYNDPGFYPNWYERTEKFLNSCAYNLLSPTKAEIGIDTDNMRYSNGFSGETVALLASESMHGSPLYQTETKSYWNAFLEWADENAVKILKIELEKLGFTIK